MSERTPEVIALSKIDLDASPHVRVTIDEDVVCDYLQRRTDGTLLPPIDVFWDIEKAAYLVADGRHRVEAESRKGEDSILAVVHGGGARECLQFALSANSKHGQRRSKADLRLVITTALQDAEWSACSNRLLAGLCNVSEQMIRRFRQEMEPDVSEEVVSNKGVSGGLDSGAPIGAPGESEKPKPRLRKGKDGKEYPAESPKPAVKEPVSKAPAKAKPGGKEVVSPEVRKEAKATFGAFVRTINKVPEWKELLEPHLDAIATAMKEHWSRGGK